MLIVHFSLPGFVLKIFCGLFLQGREFSVQLRGWEFAGDAPEDGAGIIFDDVADQDAESGKRAGQRGHDHVRNAESFGQGAGVQASGAAEGYEREIARIAAALDGDYADGFLHGGVDHADYAGGETVRGSE